MARTDKADYEEQVVKRLNIVITLLIDLVKGEQSNREKIRLLAEAGLDYKDIASILNKDKNYVAVELNTLKNKRKKVEEQLS